MAPTYDAVVAGTGMGGLTAAGRLAAAGLRVLILESRRAPGGCLGDFRRGPYLFDSGCSFLAAIEPQEELGEFLDQIGARDRIEFLRVGNRVRVLCPEANLELRTTDTSYPEAVSAAFPEYRDALARLDRSFRKTGREIERLSVLNGWGRVLMPLLCPRLILHARKTLGAMIDREKLSPMVRSLITNLPATAPAGEISFLFAATVLTKSAVSGIYYPRGGFGEFARTILDALRQNGAEVRFCEGLNTIEHDGKHVHAAVTDKGERIETHAIVAGFHPQDALRKLDGPSAPHLEAAEKRAAAFRHSASAFMVYLGLKPDRDWSQNDFMTTVFECADADRVYGAIQAGEIPDPAILHIVMPAALKSHVEAVGAPSAKIIMPVPYAPFARAREEGESVYAELKERLAQRLIERAGSYIPALRGAIEFHEAATPLTFEKWTGNHFGAIYGLEPVPDQFGPWRWPNAGFLKGLYFAGHYSRPAHGIVGACYSGRFAANSVLRDR